MDQHEIRRQVWRDLDTGWALTAELVSAVGVWMGIGWLLDRWLGTWPWLMAAGVALGFALGTYLVYLRYTADSLEQEARRSPL